MSWYRELWLVELVPRDLPSISYIARSCVYNSDSRAETPVLRDRKRNWYSKARHWSMGIICSRTLSSRYALCPTASCTALLYTVSCHSRSGYRTLHCTTAAHAPGPACTAPHTAAELRCRFPTLITFSEFATTYREELFSLELHFIYYKK